MVEESDIQFNNFRDFFSVFQKISKMLVLNITDLLLSHVSQCQCEILINSKLYSASIGIQYIIICYIHCYMPLLFQTKHIPESVYKI